jgi:hypothetical protein
MRKILATEEHLQIPPVLYSDPFFRITYLIKEDIRKYKWIEGEKGPMLSWEQARQEWTEVHGDMYEKFLINTLSFPDVTSPKKSRGEPVFAAGNMLATLPHKRADRLPVTRLIARTGSCNYEPKGDCAFASVQVLQASASHFCSSFASSSSSSFSGLITISVFVS